ncbi:MAG: hypothetical protein IPK18_05855 [Sphingobacteriales bacterium]|jgi:hypothetical protein|nr:MAG: hypothetical protein IPK18_05855 [Sphingobacteriales bacterium]
MKKLLFLLISAILFLSSCKKEAAQKNTRIKTYEVKYLTLDPLKLIFSYNSFNKIDSIEILISGTKQLTYYCKYKSDHSLDSLINTYGANRIARKVEYENFKIKKLGNYTITYTNSGFINTFTNDTYLYRYEYSGDSIMTYQKIGNDPEQPEKIYKISSNIKNPFYINGFTNEFSLFSCIQYELEAYVTDDLFAPYCVTEINLGSQKTTYNIDGLFNNYPLKETVSYSTSSFITTMKFTYEEF